MITNYTTFATNYGSSSYNTVTYDTPTATTTATGAGSSASAGGSTLANTGILVGGIVAFAAVILIVALIIRVWKRPTPVKVEADN